MKRALFAALLLSLALAVPAFAVESDAPANLPATAPGAKFDQRKAQILKHYDERIAKLQQEKACVQTTKNDDELRSCRRKSGPLYGPGGPVGAGRPGITPPPQGQ